MIIRTENGEIMESFEQIFSLKGLFYVHMETSSQNIYYQHNPDMGLWTEELSGIPNLVKEEDVVCRMVAMALLGKAKKIELSDTHKLYQYTVE